MHEANNLKKSVFKVERFVFVNVSEHVHTCYLTIEINFESPDIVNHICSELIFSLQVFLKYI